jgi:hypothetical protein
MGLVLLTVCTNILLALFGRMAGITQVHGIHAQGDCNECNKHELTDTMNSNVGFLGWHKGLEALGYTFCTKGMSAPAVRPEDRESGIQFNGIFLVLRNRASCALYLLLAQQSSAVARKAKGVGGPKLVSMLCPVSSQTPNGVIPSLTEASPLESPS